MEPSDDDPTSPTPPDEPLAPAPDQSESPGADEAASGPPPRPDEPAPRLLRRSARHRMLAGVAAGIVDYFGIDPVIVRVVFIVLAVFGGSGILLYGAGWLLIPSDHSGHSVAQEWTQRPPPRRSIVVFVIGGILAVVAASDLFSSGPWWPHRNGGVEFFLAIVALALVIVFMAGSARTGRGMSRLRWLVVTTLVAVVAVAAVSVTTLFTVEALSGVPLSGGIGASQWHPATTSQVKPVYRLAMGNLVVDLSGVDFSRGTTDVKATVGIGRLLVEVPPGPAVSVTAHSGLGEVQVFGQANGGYDSVQSAQSGHSGRGGGRIVLDADAGVGQVQVVRAG